MSVVYWCFLVGGLALVAFGLVNIIFESGKGV